MLQFGYKVSAFPSGDVSGRFRRPSPPPIPLRQRFRPFPSPVTSAIPLRRRFRLFSLPVTSAHPSPATFKAFFVARHLRPSLFGNVSGRFRRPSPPPIPLRRRFRLFSSPVTSTHPSPATFKAFFVARHLRHTSPATFQAFFVARHLRLHDTAGLIHRFPGDRIARNAVPVASRLQICQRCAQLGRIHCR